MTTINYRSKVGGALLVLSLLFGIALMFDNARTYLQSPLQPGERVSVSLPIQVPSASGEYQVELDLVWEGMLWFKENGNPTSKIDLLVI